MKRTVMTEVTRDNQQPDVIYVSYVENTVFVVHEDGEGRFFYDDVAEAVEQHGLSYSRVIFVERVSD